MIVFFLSEVLNINVGCCCSCERTQRLTVTELLEEGWVGYTLNGPRHPELVMGSFLRNGDCPLASICQQIMPSNEVPIKGTLCVWKGKRKLCGAVVIVIII